MDEDEQVSSDIFDQEEVQPYEPARSFELPQVQFYSIEYPGYVSQNSESLAAAIRSLGGQEAIDNVFRQPRAKLLELRLRPDEPLAHPIPGEVVNTSKILVEVVRRKKRRKAKLPNPASGSNQDSSNLMDIDDPSHSSLDPQTATPDTLPIQEAPWEDNGKFVIKPLGTIAKTIRFRALSDYQFIPDTTDPIIKFREAMSRLDPNEMVETVRSFKFAKELEDYSIPVAGTTTSNSTDITSHESIPQMQSNLRLPPPPIFLRSTLPLHYNYKANPFSVVQTITNEETGEEKQRLINKTRFKGFGALTVDFHDIGPVPSGVTEAMEAQRGTVSQDLLQRCAELFVKRPVWSRVALLNQFSQTERREIFNSKVMIPLVSYSFNDGPFRDMYVRFGYDPRKDIEARFYQRVSFRNAANQVRRRAGVVPAEGKSSHEGEQPRPHLFEMSHVFDGKTMQHEVGPGFQLCDIHDPLLERMIHDTSELRTECHERDGFYTAAAMDRIKAVLRRKLYGLIEDGRIVPDEECADILASNPVVTKTAGGTEIRVQVKPKNRYTMRRRNKALNAMAPEELAAARLRAAVRKQEREAAHSGGSQKDKGDDSSESEDIYDDEQDKDKED